MQPLLDYNQQIRSGHKNGISFDKIEQVIEDEDKKYGKAATTLHQVLIAP